MYMHVCLLVYIFLMSHSFSQFLVNNVSFTYQQSLSTNEFKWLSKHFENLCSSTTRECVIVFYAGIYITKYS